MTAAELPHLSLGELRQLLQTRQISAREAVEALNARAEALDPQIGAYLSRDLDNALREADAADISLPLGGVPLAIKDIINVAGQPCTCASRMLRNYRAPYDATVVKRLRAAGAIPFGKTNMDEFAMGSSSENSALQTTRNPWDLGRIPGGSSGGSAAAVAADLAYGALGTDTGGSIRQPAALCGVVGLKPSYGRVSRFGLTAFASSLDQAGPITKTVADAAFLLEMIAGPDENDSTACHEAVPAFGTVLQEDVKGLRVGLVREYAQSGIDLQVKSAMEAAVAQLTRLGAEIVEVSLPHTEHAVATYYIIATAEASANLARFDGVRYGHRSAHARNLAEHYTKTRAEGFGPEVKRRLILGTYVLSSGYYDAYYARAQKVRRLIQRDFEKAFTKADVLLAPTSPTLAPRLGELMDDPLHMYLADIFTIPANLAGICGISVPAGFGELDGTRLPIGLQFLGPRFGETLILRAAHAYEQSTVWHQQRPPLAEATVP